MTDSDERQQKDHDLLIEMNTKLDMVIKQLPSFATKAEITSLPRPAKVCADAFAYRTEFDPVRRLVYGMASAVLLSVLGAVVAVVIKSV